MTPEEKKWIDESTYEQLLTRWRHAPVGDPIFTAEAGAYYQAVMRMKKDALSFGKRVEISKSVGWGKEGRV